MPGPRAPKILYMPLEFPSWATGKPQSYTAQFGLEEGMLANGAAPRVVPAFPPAAGAACWQDHVPDLFPEPDFDQAWLGLVHARYGPGFCAWLAEKVPVRVGLLFESMTYPERDHLELPALAGRAAHVLRQVRALGLTHVLCSDERDAAAIQGDGGAQAVWFPTAVPERFIRQGYLPPRTARAAFFGNLYSEERQRLAALPELRDLLAFPRGEDLDSHLPAGFDALHAGTARALAAPDAPRAAILDGYVEALRELRRAIFTRWMAGLSDWNGLVNLPSYFQGYAGRVFEAMAAHVPVLSWEVPDRPRTRALFEDGREILLFPREEPAALAGLLDRMRREPALGPRIADAARGRLLAGHTSELRVRQILDWIGTGREPDYGC